MVPGQPADAAVGVLDVGRDAMGVEIVESATRNERSEITVEHEVAGQTRTVHFRQIVGAVARRVVTRVAPGDDVATGERIGLMKFGSRMDVFVPPEVQLTVATGDRTVAGETVIGRWTR